MWTFFHGWRRKAGVVALSATDGLRIRRTRLRPVVVRCVLIVALALCVKLAPTVVMYYAFSRASSVEVSYIVGNKPGHLYETVELTGADMAAFCTQIKKGTSPLYLQVRAILPNFRVRAFDLQGGEIASIGIYSAGEKSESLILLRDLAQNGTPVENRRLPESRWTIQMMRQAR